MHDSLVRSGLYPSLPQPARLIDDLTSSILANYWQDDVALWHEVMRGVKARMLEHVAKTDEKFLLAGAIKIEAERRKLTLDGIDLHDMVTKEAEKGSAGVAATLIAEFRKKHKDNVREFSEQ